MAVELAEKCKVWIEAVKKARKHIPSRFPIMALGLDDTSEYFAAIVKLDSRFELHGIGNIETQQFTKWYLFDKKYPPEDKFFYELELPGDLTTNAMRNLFANWESIEPHLLAIEKLIKNPSREVN